MAFQFRSVKHINLDDSISKLDTSKVLKVGWHEKKRYEDGAYYAEIAAQNEYGAPHKHIPPRPFMGPAVANNKSEWMMIVTKGSKKVVKGESTVEDVLNQLGRKATADVVKAIKAVTSPSLADSTIANRLRKRKNKKVTESLRKPLIDTGIMWRAVSHAVEEE